MDDFQERYQDQERRTAQARQQTDIFMQRVGLMQSDSQSNNQSPQTSTRPSQPRENQQEQGTKRQGSIQRLAEASRSFEHTARNLNGRLSSSSSNISSESTETRRPASERLDRTLDRAREDRRQRQQQELQSQNGQEDLSGIFVQAERFSRTSKNNTQKQFYRRFLYLGGAAVAASIGIWGTFTSNHTLKPWLIGIGVGGSILGGVLGLKEIFG